MTPDYVLAVDPGLTTGYAQWDAHGLGAFGELPKLEFLVYAEAWSQMAKQYGRGVIVCEEFVTTQGTAKKGSVATEPIKSIGFLEVMEYRYDVELVISGIAQAKRRMPNETLERLGWYAVGQVHARDALRHLACYLIDNGMMDPRLVIPEDER